jgi:hypothetical protein
MAAYRADVSAGEASSTDGAIHTKWGPSPGPHMAGNGTHRTQKGNPVPQMQRYKSWTAEAQQEGQDKHLNGKGALLVIRTADRRLGVCCKTIHVDLVSCLACCGLLVPRFPRQPSAINQWNVLGIDVVTRRAVSALRIASNEPCANSKHKQNPVGSVPSKYKKGCQSSAMQVICTHFKMLFQLVQNFQGFKNMNNSRLAAVLLRGFTSRGLNCTCVSFVTKSIFSFFSREVFSFAGDIPKCGTGLWVRVLCGGRRLSLLRWSSVSRARRAAAQRYRLGALAARRPHPTPASSSATIPTRCG